MSLRNRSAVMALIVVLAASAASAVVARGPQDPSGAGPGGDHVSGADGAPGAVGDPSIIDILEWGLAGIEDLAPPAETAPDAESTVSLGPDGRLTVLLIGSDYRPGYKYPIEHTDVMMVMSLDPRAKTIAAASIPRDVVYFPRANGGTSGATRVNNMYHDYTTESGYAFEEAAMRKFQRDVAYALGLEIDYYAFIRFTGLDAMIDKISGVRVRIPKYISDPVFKDEPTSPSGIYFPGGVSDYFLGGWSAVRCPSQGVKCHRAIVYVRSRKGSVGGGPNSDSKRARRQQTLIVSVVNKVTGFDGTALDALRIASESGVDSGIKTDMPRTLDDLLYVQGLLRGAKFAKGGRVVFAPSKFATTCCNLPEDSSKLYLSAVRGWINANMPAVP